MGIPLREQPYGRLLYEVLGAGGKPSTWLPPGKLADLLNNCTVHMLSPHAHVIFWCVPTMPYARGDVRTLCNLLSRSLVLPIAALLFFLCYLVVCPLIHAIITCNICYSTCVASSSGVHPTFPMHMVFPKRSVILLNVSVLLLIAVLLLSWAVLVIFLYFHATIKCAV